MVVGCFVLLVTSWRRYRREVREDFVRYLGEHHPEIEVLEASASGLRLKTPAGQEGVFSPLRLYQEIANHPGNDADARTAAFAAAAGAILESDAAAAIDPQRDRERLRPRIVRDDFVEAARTESGTPLGHAPVGVPGLSVVCVLDAEHSVTYVTEQMLEDLGLDFVGALEVAKRQLRPTLPADALGKVTREGTLSVVKILDTYDAARLLLLPDELEPEQTVAAMIPDRDTLALAPVPADGDWSGLRRIAKTPAGEVLCDQPLLVSRSGITVA